jgi:TPR repeat protein
MLCHQGDYAVAAQILERLAKRGDAHAMTWLAWLYDSGSGVRQDVTRAADFYRSAAEKGVRIAQTTLAMKYWKGDGVQKDLERGQYWMRRASNTEGDVVPAVMQSVIQSDRLSMINHDWYTVPKSPERERGGTRSARRYAVAIARN